MTSSIAGENADNRYTLFPALFDRTANVPQRTVGAAGAGNDALKEEFLTRR